MPKAIIEVHHRHVLRDLIEKEIAENGPACDLNHLDVSEMVDISNTFEGTGFAGDVSSWQVGQVIDLRRVFADCPYSGDLSQWDTNPRGHTDGMLAPSFKGTLPLLEDEPAQERTAAYITMFDGLDNYERYLAEKPFGPLHAAFIVDVEKTPSWLNPEQLERIQHAQELGLALGLPYDELCALVTSEYRNPKKETAPESISMDFGQ